MYNTIEAYVEDAKITFEEGAFVPKKRSRVLVTFIDDDMDEWCLYDLDNSEVSSEFLGMSEKTLKKDKSLFTNI